jgi:hypothetical protein
VCKPKASTSNGSSSSSSSSSSNACPPGKPQVMCLVDPCRSKQCGAGQTCVSNYCGGCNAECQPAVKAAGELSKFISTAGVAAESCVIVMQEVQSQGSHCCSAAAGQRYRHTRRRGTRIQRTVQPLHQKAKVLCLLTCA